jgi:tetratricopeptide (TPR) repeat protein
LSLANSSISLRTSIPLIALLLLLGCSGTEPTFIYNQAQATEAISRITKLTTNPIQKFISNVELTDADKRDLRAALPIIEEVLQYDPITLNSYNLKGKIYLALEKPTEAKAAFLDGIALSIVKDDETAKLIRSDTYTELAKIHYKENDFKSGEIAAKNAIATLDTDPAPHVILGRIYEINNDKQSAKDEALRALLINADNEPARILFRDLNSSPKVSP